MAIEERNSETCETRCSNPSKAFHVNNEIQQKIN